MRNIYRRFSLGDIVESRINFAFGNGITCGGGFIKNNERSIFIQCSCNGDFLFLAAGKVDAVLFIDLECRLFELFRKFLNFFFYTRKLKAFPNTLFIVITAAGNIFAYGKGKELEILKYNEKQFALRKPRLPDMSVQAIISFVIAP